MRRTLLISATAALTFAIGIVVGNRLNTPAATPTTQVITATGTPRPRAGRRDPRVERLAPSQARTAAGAVAAATASVAALDRAAILDPARLRQTLKTLASTNAFPALLDLYRPAAALTRDRLGLGTRPEPRVIIRATPVGYRIDGFTRDAATVSIWRVGLVGSGATIEPQQSWRTETVSLTWQRDRWRVLWLASVPGPTPPLNESARSSPEELFSAVPRFEEFTRVLP